MNILWITNIIFPEAQVLLSGSGGSKSSGGWILGAAEALVHNPDIRLSIASLSKQVNVLTCLQGKKIVYYLLPYGKGNLKVNHEYEALWIEVCNKVQPDVVHLHGTEYSHGLAYLEACGAEHFCVSIQGLISECYKYYMEGISQKDIRNAVTPMSLFHGGVNAEARRYQIRGDIEKEIIQRSQHIMGRTSWDKAHVCAINPSAQYHYCGETLRSSFYERPTWSYSNCVPHSIFLTQASYPIKGFHIFLRSLPLIIRHIPDVTVRVAGPNICLCDTAKQKLLISNYGNIVRKLIKEHHLERVVTFTGPLDEEEMKQEYLNCNVFVCPSTIENSPNSIGEAQLLGVPVISSFVGGVPDMMQGDEEHMYRCEDFEELAYKVVHLFERNEKINTEPAQRRARIRHNPEDNMLQLLHIYKEVIQG